MGEWLIFNELFLVIYCIVKYIESGILDSTFFLIVILIYISSKMIFYIYKNSYIRKIVLTFLVILIIFSYFNVFNFIIIFLPINIYQIIYYFKKDRRISFLIIFSTIFFVDRNIISEYLMVGGLTCIICDLFYLADLKIAKLSEKNDYLKLKNSSLYEKLNKDIEYEKQIKYLSQLEERNKIAQEIHDNIGHTISGSLMQLEAAKLLIDKDKHKTEKIIDNTIGVLRTGMENVRSTLRNIKPASEQLGINRVKLMVEEFEINSGIDMSFIYDGDINKITYAQWRILIDNTNEALTNAIKYSNANKIKVCIKVLNKIIKMEVKDNGVGVFNLKKGLGLLGMEERTENIGGKIIIDAAEGFSVITLLPVQGN